MVKEKLNLTKWLLGILALVVISMVSFVLIHLQQTKVDKPLYESERRGIEKKLDKIDKKQDKMQDTLVQIQIDMRR